jgi:hypothetical protein
MKTRLLTFCLLICALLGGMWLAPARPAAKAGYELQLASPVAPIGTGFTYQGQLKQGGSPANGTYDLEFKLFDALTAGNQIGSTVTKADQAVVAGLFTVTLDFGTIFDGTAL